MVRRRLIFAAIAFLIAIVSYALFKAGMSIPYAEQSEYLATIRNVSAIIFGVCGAWLAISYPKAVGSAQKARNPGDADQASFLGRAQDDASLLIGFIWTMILSVAVVSLAILMPFVRYFLGLFAEVLIVKEYLRGALFAMIGMASILQIGLLFFTLRNTYSALKDLNHDLSAAKTQIERDENSQL